jgi:integrase/recombinase XerD
MPVVTTPPLDLYLNHCEHERGLAALTMKRYRLTLSAIEQWLKLHDSCLLDANETHVQGYVRARTQAGTKSGAVSNEVLLIRDCFRFWTEIGLRDKRDVCARMDTPKLEQRLPRVLNRIEVAKLLGAVPANAMHHLRDVAILETLYACGLRAAELGGLLLSHVDLAGRTVRVLGKGTRERVIPLGEPAAKAITAYLGVRAKYDSKASPVVFLTVSGRPLSDTAIWGLVTRYASLAGLEGVHPHTLRHCFATHLLAGGADLRVVQELLGHDDLVTTQRYTHLDTTHLRSIHATFHPRG